MTLQQFPAIKAFQNHQSSAWLDKRTRQNFIPPFGAQYLFTVRLQMVNYSGYGLVSKRHKQIYTAPTNPLTNDIRHTIQQH